MEKLRYIQGGIYSCIGIVLMWVAAIATLYSDTSNKFGLYIALPLSFVFCTLKNRGFRLNTYEKILYALFAWDCISFLWADDKDMAATELHALLGCFLVTYVVSVLAREKRNVPYLYFAFVLLYLSAWLYASKHILSVMVSDSDRLNDDNLNANTLAYYTFYVSFLAYTLSEICQKKHIKKFWIVVFWLMLPASFGVSLLTASRQILIVQIPLYAMLIYIRYIKGLPAKRKITFAAVLLAVIIAAAGQIANIYNDSLLKQRAEVEVGDDPRADLAREAIQIGLENLPLGLGAGNFQSISSTRQISHNSFTESFVNLGIPGFCLYIALLGIFTSKQWHRYRKNHDKMYFVFFTFGLIYMLDGFFFVFYNAVWLISFFMLVAAHSETYYIDSQDLTTETKPNP
ncbi:hypothetical protein C7120_06840 [Prevotella sp. oral taxon 376]|uniref:O-antigen ligase family protein n=1 Tax=Prevotella sp. oral taxon 376 TaxID=712466 RepID=UPI000D1E5DA8|nr:O-antigen ligase family protein [Prevotella sp. oral taxon 376]PTL34248.1 hypothetical protein C7120_06840 [Prevotella sp. oral taxon 376]